MWHSSDIDIAIDNKAKISMLELNQMRHMIDVLNTIQEVDLVDFHNVPIAMQANILNDVVVWKK
jgi:predicted nucleotidyltransferase